MRLAFHRSFRRARLRLKVLILANACTCVAQGVDPFPGDPNGISLTASFPSSVEPSGAAWHPRLERLLVVDDGGWLIAVDDSGHEVTTWWIGGDLEAVCIANPDSDLVYVADESTNRVLEFNLTTSEVTRDFDLGWILQNPTNQGIEALTFVPIRDDPEGGLFYVGHQLDGRIYVFRFPLATPQDDQPTWITVLDPISGYSDLSAMCYDSQAHVIYCVWDYADLLVAMAINGEVLQMWSVPGDQQEGIATIGCRLFLADDTGPVAMHSFWAIEGDLDRDGVTDCDDQCPDSPPGILVDQFGCPNFDCPFPPRPVPAERNVHRH
jgi:hypothetical protein